MRVLIVDDIEENRYMLQALLRANGHEVAAAQNGAEALAETGRAMPDLIVTDLLMPVMDGFTLCRTCRGRADLADIPIIVYTATYTDPEDEKLALNEGADLFLIKPLEIQEMMSGVNELMRKHAAGELRRGRAPAPPPEGVLRQYNAALIRKLEDKLEELDAAGRKLRTIFECAAQGIVTIDAEGRMDAVNLRMEEMFGYSRSELAGRPLEMFLPAGFRERYLAQPSARFEVELTGRRKDGSEFPLVICVSHMPDSDGVRAIGLVSDITARRKQEEANRRLEDEVRQLQKMESIGLLAGGVAHDFNNLLTVINGYAAIALRKLKEGDPLRHAVLQIQGAGGTAAALTQQLLAFGRRQLREPQALNINRIVEGMEQMMSRLLRADVKMRLELDPALHSVEADAHQIEQVLLNLVGNAADAMRDGGALTIQTANVRFGDGEAPGQLGPGGYVMLAVRDTGVGMAPEVAARVFEPFFTTKRKGEGTGLGLATVFGIAAQSGGHATVESQPGAGTCFRVYFPATAERAAPPAALEDAAPHSRGNATILLVEDNDSVREFTALTLRDLGYAVHEASSGAEALRIAAENRDAVDLVITDMVMPAMNGVELVAALGPLLKRRRVLYVSGYPGDHSPAESQPGCSFLLKPFSVEQLAGKLEELLAL